MTTHFENPSIVETIVAHYLTASGRRGMKTFTATLPIITSANPVADFQKWEKSVERMGYNIDCVDTYYLGNGRAGNVQSEFVGPPEYELVHNARFGGMQWQRKDTPWSCSVASEAYWSN